MLINNLTSFLNKYLLLFLNFFGIKPKPTKLQAINLLIIMKGEEEYTQCSLELHSKIRDLHEKYQDAQFLHVLDHFREWYRISMNT